MSDYRKKYDEWLPSMEAAINDMPGSLSDIIPNLTKDRLIKVIRRISVLLGRLDSKGARHPQYLWMNGVLAPDLIIGQASSIIANSALGPSTFVQSHLTTILNIYDALEKAIGTDASETRALLSSVNTDVSVAVSQIDELSAQAQKNLDELRKSQNAARASLESINQILESARNDAAKADSARRAIEALTNPDGRNKSSLESLARKARERITEIDQIFVNATAELNKVAQGSSDLGKIKTESEVVIADLRRKKSEAEEILNLSSQAGLAASYKTESNDLKKRHLAYSGILYASSILAFIVAILYVIPSLNEALKTTESDGSHLDFWKALSFTVLRASVLAPLVYVIYFTQRTISGIELLRMDYAEKSAASLAYSGYKEQMEADPTLIKQLQASLLMKFSEHPERLLSDGRYHNKAKVKTSGFEAEFESSSSGSSGETDADQ